MEGPNTVRKVSRVKIRQLCPTIPEADESWRDEAKCYGKDINLFVYGSDEPSNKQRRELVSICNNCKVVLTCRKEGLRTLSEGWWGNMTEHERFVWAANNLFLEEFTS